MKVSGALFRYLFLGNSKKDHKFSFLSLFFLLFRSFECKAERIAGMPRASLKLEKEAYGVLSYHPSVNVLIILEVLQKMIPGTHVPV